MNKALQTLKDRGFFQQCTDVDALSACMDKKAITFYVGTDPTAGAICAMQGTPVLHLSAAEPAE